ncbi:MAG: FAD-binding oxidoreductase [Nevskiales bacterium]
MSALSEAFVRGLRDAVGTDNCSTDPADCLPYGYDNSRRVTCPQALAFATTHNQVSTIVRLCHDHAVPLTTRGRGTNTTGATVPIAGGLVLSLERMNRILEINAADRLAVVEAGVTNGEVQTAAGEQGFFWPPDPTSAGYSSVGGNLACNAAGPHAVKYGSCRENTLGLVAITGTGETLRTGVRTTKGVVGYDLTRLLIGSEGTLGIITEATLKLTPKPESKRTLRGLYRDIQSAADAVAAIMAQPQTPSVLEFIDGTAINMIRGYTDTDLPAEAGAMLMLEVDGSAVSLDHSVTAVEQAARNTGLLEWRVANTDDEIASLWATRKALSPAQRKIAPKKINEDVVVPVSRIPELITTLEQLAGKHQITIVNFGHAGNGNIHVNLLGNPDDPRELQAMHDCLDEVFDLVLKLGGTLSGEHGVGIEKKAYVAREIDPYSLALMRQLKSVFDPKGILNPGKTLPEA